MASNSPCILSHRDRALSTVLTAIIGSVVGGVTGGAMTAWLTAWISWLAVCRVLAVGIWAIFETVRLKPLQGGSQFSDFWKPLRMNFLKELDGPLFREDAISKSTTFLGWAGWIYQAIYAPISQVLWIVAYSKSSPGSLMIVKALGVSVTALPLTYDTRGRYGEALGNLLGCWARCAFNIITAASCLTQGCLSAMLLILAAKDWSKSGKDFDKYSWVFIILYPVYSLVWMYVSFKYQIPVDESRSTNSVRSVINGLVVGCFGAGLLAWPALTVMMLSSNSNGVGLKKYLHCESVLVWHKFVAISP